MLAGLIRSPNRFSPFNNLKKAVRERNAVLARMHKLDFITEQQMAAAAAGYADQDDASTSPSDLDGIGNRPGRSGTFKRYVGRICF